MNHILEYAFDRRLPSLSNNIWIALDSIKIYTLKKDCFFLEKKIPHINLKKKKRFCKIQRIMRNQKCITTIVMLALQEILTLISIGEHQ